MSSESVNLLSDHEESFIDLQEQEELSFRTNRDSVEINKLWKEIPVSSIISATPVNLTKTRINEQGTEKIDHCDLKIVFKLPYQFSQAHLAPHILSESGVCSYTTHIVVGYDAEPNFPLEPAQDDYHIIVPLYDQTDLIPLLDRFHSQSEMLLHRTISLPGLHNQVWRIRILINLVTTDIKVRSISTSPIDSDRISDSLNNAQVTLNQAKNKVVEKFRKKKNNPASSEYQILIPQQNSFRDSEGNHLSESQSEEPLKPVPVLVYYPNNVPQNFAPPSAVVPV
jgi:hypothetical protein